MTHLPVIFKFYPTLLHSKRNLSQKKKKEREREGKFISIQMKWKVFLALDKLDAMCPILEVIFSFSETWKWNQNTHYVCLFIT